MKREYVNEMNKIAIYLKPSVIYHSINTNIQHEECLKYVRARFDSEKDPDLYINNIEFLKLLDNSV